MDIFKAVIPAGGLGTRFLPITKAIPKEMLPILNKPAMHYILEEGVQAGITDYTIITSRGKEALVNYSDINPELDSILQEHKKNDSLNNLNSLLKKIHCAYVRQSEPLGLGHAIGLARNFIGKEHFGIFLPDDIIFSAKSAIGQLIATARQEKANVIAVQEVPHQALSSYGIVSIKKQITPSLFQINGVVEKPAIKDAPSNLAIIGRYVLSHKIFEAIDETSPDERNEIQLTDAIGSMIANNEKFFVLKVQGQRFDTGTPSGWLRANIHAGLQNPQYAQEIKTMLQEVPLDLLAHQKPHVISMKQY